LAPDDTQAGAPERNVFDIYPKPLAQSNSIGKSGGGEEFIILPTERIGILEVAGIKPQPE